jgi:hypothetical protein
MGTLVAIIHVESEEELDIVLLKTIVDHGGIGLSWLEEASMTMNAITTEVPLAHANICFLNSNMPAFLVSIIPCSAHNT